MSQAPFDIIAGARPNFMKVASIVKAFEAGRRQSGDACPYRLVHTGQHYDKALSGDFFEQLDIAAPHANLQVGSGSHAEQTAAIMVGYERLLRQSACRVCVVVGDVTSTMACAITARKMGVAVAHVEAGLRCGDWTMPEEINRRVTDAVTSLFFTTSQTACDNLLREGVRQESIHFVGNTMIDTLLGNLNRLQPPAFWTGDGLREREFVVLTLHRPANVDQRETVVRLVNTVAGAVQGRRVVFPAHPRTAGVLGAFPERPQNVILVPPQPYLEFMYLVRASLAVITDSGGITEETTVLGIPCLTLRDVTERPETVSLGTNELIGSDLESLKGALQRVAAGQWKRGRVPPLWDGHSGQRIVHALKRSVAGDDAVGRD